jgi:hypothetical protein
MMTRRFQATLLGLAHAEEKKAAEAATKGSK